MGDVVLSARGRAAVAQHLHGNAREDQPFHQSHNGFRLPAGKPLRLGKALVHCPGHHGRYSGAVVLADHLAGQHPVKARGQLAQHIAKARGDHLLGRSAQHVRIPDDGHGRYRLVGDLIPIIDHGGDRGGVSVHRRGGAYNDVGEVQPEGRHAGGIVNGAAAHGYQYLCIVPHRQQYVPQGRAVRMQGLVAQL